MQRPNRFQINCSIITTCWCHGNAFFIKQKILWTNKGGPNQKYMQSVMKPAEQIETAKTSMYNQINLQSQIFIHCFFNPNIWIKQWINLLIINVYKKIKHKNIQKNTKIIIIFYQWNPHKTKQKKMQKRKEMW